MHWADLPQDLLAELARQCFAAGIVHDFSGALFGIFLNFGAHCKRFPGLILAVYINYIKIYILICFDFCLFEMDLDGFGEFANMSKVGSFIADHGNAMSAPLETMRSNSLFANIYGCCTASNLVSDHYSSIKQNHSRLRKPTICFDLFCFI